jgi:hypothetical protein
VRLANWPCPQPGGNEAGELAVSFKGYSSGHLLILPALFDEANRMRRFTLEVMRRLAAAGIGSVLPDLPGCNESLTPLEQCTLTNWQGAVRAAAVEFSTTHVLAIRGGGLLLPDAAKGWHYGPVKGATILRQMLRARVISSREAGRLENIEALLAQGLDDGLELTGHRFGAALLRELQAAVVPEREGVSAIGQDVLGGSPLWLRAEPCEDRAQADALAALIAIGMAA